MDQIEIAIFQTELFHGKIECLERGIIAVIAVPDLGGHKQFLARDSALANPQAHALLIAVYSGGVNVPITAGDRLSHGIGRYFAIRSLPGAETHTGDFHPVAQRKTVL